MNSMTENLQKFRELENNFHNDTLDVLEYGRPRFAVVHPDVNKSMFSTFHFASRFYRTLVNCKKDAKVFFEHENGFLEDFTEFFDIPVVCGDTLTIEQKTAINAQGKVLVKLLSNKTTLRP